MARRPANTSPGRGRLNYGLHEKVSGAGVPEAARQARQWVEDNIKPDVLELRGPQWAASTWTKPMKHSRAVSDRSLTNTLISANISPHDLRKTLGTTHKPADHTATIMDRCKHGSDSWQSSTTLNRSEMLKGVQAVTELSLTATKLRSQQLLAPKGGHVSLITQANAVAQQGRALKASHQAADVGALEAQYGKEGAAAMLTILAHPKYGSKPAPGTWRSRTRPEELAAVRNLPCEEPGSPASRPSEPGEREQEAGQEDHLGESAGEAGQEAAQQEATALEAETVEAVAVKVEDVKGVDY
mmetsp:Transcript_21584/g.36774  ORF Transcript_21584/g.36774 Transcript_21584/m.36774 type:complete len:299 (+) Transcript_21584:104-1000(+)|eukprot:CAMPEP_0119103146 /NCGR_PEP_ID=MMETSP1180-20130426/1673_1 /TAXON_ID=3052 ORGANISM="Chlamydomonas cf sp, Strain CCMP681" /NCGR_SAMPLE_ID=MMETSP1180 /ASSEMBLY_ACC=CAM_ASM_000741 /LENGTH=298 /DNA_ID=CAMNT_0007087589 /DNA_START=104 /DNA_END=1000 /DNA_ORIENTATION=+